jgi:hypothetical protein
MHLLNFVHLLTSFRGLHVYIAFIFSGFFGLGFPFLLHDYKTSDTQEGTKYNMEDGSLPLVYFKSYERLL